jgi:hypothetical protein
LSTNFWGKNVFFQNICAHKVTKLCSEKQNKIKKKKVGVFFAFFFSKKEGNKKKLPAFELFLYALRI